MMRQEIYFTDNTPEKQVKVLEAVKAIAADNVVIDPSKNMGFERAFGHISLDGEWGMVRGDVEDVQLLSEKFPEDTFTLIRYQDRTIATDIEDLSGKFYKCDVKNGSILAEYQPARVSWVQQ